MSELNNEAKTNWALGDYVQPEDLNAIGALINNKVEIVDELPAGEVALTVKYLRVGNTYYKIVTGQVVNPEIFATISPTLVIKGSAVNNIKFKYWAEGLDNIVGDLTLKINGEVYRSDLRPTKDKTEIILPDIEAINQQYVYELSGVSAVSEDPLSYTVKLTPISPAYYGCLPAEQEVTDEIFDTFTQANIYNINVMSDVSYNIGENLYYVSIDDSYNYIYPSAGEGYIQPVYNKSKTIEKDGLVFTVYECIHFREISATDTFTLKK